jgi:hypothetical protein
MSTQDNIVKVEYNGRKYNVNVNVENDLSIDLNNPEIDANNNPFVAAIAKDKNKADESAQETETEKQNSVTQEMIDHLGGRKVRRTNRRGPGRPRKTRRYRRRSIRK